MLEQKSHIAWSKDRIDLDEPFQRKWYIKQALVYGRSEDIRELDREEIRRLLPELGLPDRIRNLWENYFNAGK